MLEDQNVAYGENDYEKTSRCKIWQIRGLSLRLGALLWSKMAI